MIEMSVLIDSVGKIRDFNRLVMQFDCECDIISGAYVIDAKSIMGLFSLDVSNPVTLIVHDDDADLTEISKYEV
ncbi:MAG: HPr family phosphocarrier protein [Lachnospiraceae bacterium]|nr:HPr family phosphocarrier protein [Lachnospiraceae bacterium]